MTIYSFTNNSLEKVATTRFDNEKILERQHLQQALKHQINIVAPDCLVITEEFSEWSSSQRRIDLLAIDKNANLVVIEIKRNETGDHMELQAIRYAAMVSTLTFSKTIQIYAKYLQSIESRLDAKTSLLDFLGWEEPQEDGFALDVRIILVASDFSKEITTSVIWLNERNIDIRCVRLIPYKFQGQVLIDVQQIIPLPEAESYQIKIKQQAEERKTARNQVKDYTNYQFEDEIYNKRRLVLAVIKRWAKNNPPKDFNSLVKAFPQTLRSGGVFVLLETAKQAYKRQGIARHFLESEDIVITSSGESYAISNQWGVANINKFILQAKSLGFEIEEVS